MSGMDSDDSADTRGSPLSMVQTHFALDNQQQFTLKADLLDPERRNGPKHIFGSQNKSWLRSRSMWGVESDNSADTRGSPVSTIDF